MPMRVKCPGCQTPLNLPETANGFAGRCPRCKTVVRAPAPAQAPAAPENGPAESPAGPVPETAVRSAEAPPESPIREAAAPAAEPPLVEPIEEPVAESGTEWSHPRRRRAAEPEDEESPRTRRRRAPEPEDEDRPAGRARRKRSSSGQYLIPVIVLGILVVLCGGAGTAGFFVYRAITSKARALVAQAQAHSALGTQPRPGAMPSPEGNGPMAQVKPAAPVVLRLPPLPSAVPIQPAPISRETTSNLPDKITGLAVGGGGRFLVLQFAGLNKVGVFDVNEARITQYIPAGDPNARVAAGMTHLILYLPTSGIVQRWDLLTKQRVGLGHLETSGKIEAFCMGSASNGPLLVGEENRGARLLDATTFEPLPLPPAENGQAVNLDGGFYWASANGRVFGHTGNAGQPNGVGAYVLEGGRVNNYYQHWGTWYVQPGPDGKHVYAGGYGVLTERVQPATDAVDVGSAHNGSFENMFLPAEHGPFYMHLHLESEIRQLKRQGGDGDDPGKGITFYLLGARKPIAYREKVGMASYAEMNDLRDIGIERSVHLIPRARLLVVIPPSRDRLLLYPLDLEAELEKSGVDYLLVTSQPPTVARRGQELTYQIAAKSKAGGVTYHLESGPPDMTVSPQGLVSWKAPADYPETATDVIVSIHDAGGQEVFHTFTLNLEGGSS